MRSFDEIRTIAAARKGGAEALERLLLTPLPAGELAKVPGSVWLSSMARAIFQAGFNWSVIDAKWPGFEEAFDGFDPGRVAFYHDGDIDRLLADRRIVRNGAKITAVLENALFLQSLQAETGDALAHLAHWPVEEHGGLLTLFASRGARLGGVTGQRVCRMVGRDGYLLSPSVLKRLAEEGIAGRAPTSKKAMAAVQDAFNIWRAESGRPLTQISQILAFSVD